MSSLPIARIGSAAGVAADGEGEPRLGGAVLALAGSCHQQQRNLRSQSTSRWREGEAFPPADSTAGVSVTVRNVLELFSRSAQFLSGGCCLLSAPLPGRSAARGAGTPVHISNNDLFSGRFLWTLSCASPSRGAPGITRRRGNTLSQSSVNCRTN